jgi:peroxiredoxin
VDAAFLLSYVVLWLLVAVETLVLIGLVHAVHRMAGEGSAKPAPPDERSAMVGQQLPRFTVMTQDGRQVDSNQFLGRPTVLLFVSPDCGACASVLGNLGPFNRRGEVFVMCHGDRRECERLTARHSLKVPVGVDDEKAISSLLHVNGFPTAVAVDSEGRIRSFGYAQVDGNFENNAELQVVTTAGQRS